MTEQLDMFSSNEISDNFTKSTLATCINDILKKHIEPPCVVVPNILVAGQATMWAALAGAAKSYTAHILAACAATGTPFLGMPAIEPKKVVIVDGELSYFQFQKRFAPIFELIGKTPEDGFLKIIGKHTFQGGLPDLTHEEGWYKIRSEFEGADVVILDNIAALYRDADEMNQRDWYFYNDCIDELRHQGKAVLVLHHTDKNSTSYRGHSEIARAIDNCYIAIKDKKLSSKIRTVISAKQVKSRNEAGGEEFLKFEFGNKQDTGEFYFQKLNF